MDYAAQSARRAEVLQKTIAKWKDSAPLALARFLDAPGNPMPKLDELAHRAVLASHTADSGAVPSPSMRT